jgi:hypothetical protein
VITHEVVAAEALAVPDDVVVPRKRRCDGAAPLRRSERSKRYQGFKPKPVSDKSKRKSPVKPRRVLGKAATTVVSDSATLVSTEGVDPVPAEAHVAAPDLTMLQTPVAVLQSIGVNLHTC